MLIDWEKLTPALQQLADDYTTYAIAELKKNGSYNTGRLAKSIKLLTPTKSSKDVSISVEMLKYGIYVDNGAERGPGKQPPVQDILEWIKFKRIRVPSGMKQIQFAWLIARAIGAKGQRFKKAKPFIQSSLKLAVNQNIQNIANAGAVDMVKEIKKQFEAAAPGIIVVGKNK
jgi:hypothetical protein